MSATRSDSTHSAPAAKQPSPTAEETDFERPDAETVDEGAPVHDGVGAAPEVRNPAQVDEDDERHGYSQDSGYATSGGSPGGKRPAKKAKP